MKNQIKKSFSLFLAVLMVLSCWVWVAPQKAEAASSKYKVTIGYNVKVPTTRSGAYFRMRFYTLANNGTATTATCEVQNAYGPDVTTSGYKEFTVELSGFPVYFESRIHGGSGTTGDELEITWDEIIIGSDTTEGYDILTGGNQYSFKKENGEGAEKAFYLTGWDGCEDVAGGSDSAKTEISYAKPHIAGWETSSSNPTKLSTNLNKIGGADKYINAPTFNLGGYYDQYGVNWTASTQVWGTADSDETYISTTQKGDSAELNDIYYDATNKRVVAKADLQVNETRAATGKWEGYLVRKAVYSNDGGGTFTSWCSVPVEINYPTYAVSFNGAGSVTGLNYSMDMNDGSKATETYSEDGYYSQSLKKYPTGTATAKDANGNDAYTFQGFWTNPQPTTEGKASFNAYEADFAAPISSEKFDEYVADGGTADGNYITYNGETYYNAGTQWDTNNKQIFGDLTYYGWWLSKDLTVKFYDIDGSFLGEKTVKYGQNQSDIQWPTPTESYTSGSFQYSTFTKIWEDINGDEVSQTSYIFTHNLILTPKYKDVNFTDKYTVTFVNQNGGNISSTDYPYRTDLGSVNAIPANRSVPNTLLSDLEYSYTFVGWSSKAPINNGNYHILLEDANFDAAGNAIAINDDWIVRSGATYYPVYRRHTRTYAVLFHYKDSTGADAERQVSVKYGDQLTAPTDYIPSTYATEGNGYTFDYWEYTDGSGKSASLGYSTSVVLNKTNITLELAAVDDGENVNPIDFYSKYKDPIPTPYTVTFNYRDEAGKEVSKTTEVNHGKFITQAALDALQPADKYDDGENLVSYNGYWKVTDGAAAKTEYEMDELTSFSPTSHVTFEAVYGNPQPFYTVTYNDNGSTYTERVLVGSNLPVWTYKSTNDNGTEEDVEYLPTMADTQQGYYVFQGWYDEKQSDSNYAATNGNKYDATSTVTGNLTLYPQFKFTPFTYEIKFMSYDGKDQLAAGKFEYGQSIEAVTAVANVAAQGRAQDDTYTYSFIGWDQTVPTFCEGKDMTFIAQYKPVYRYYEAKWYNSTLVGDNWEIDKSTETEDGKTVETALLATTHHTYNSKVYAPAVDVIECPATAPAGQKYVFAGWYYKDAEGNAQPFVRGMLITSEMEFYATYTLTAKVVTVTTVVKGEETKYEVAQNTTAASIPDPVAGYVDATHHDKFTGWVTENGTAFNIATTSITADITITAVFEQSNHEFNNKELVTAPTYYAKGVMKTWCSCDSVKTEKTEEIAMLTDKVAPTGTIYLGTMGNWSSTDAVGAAATDNDPVTLYANANTDLIITINDTGDVNALYNPSGIGKGIAVVQGFISSDTFSQEEQGNAANLAITIYEADYILDEGNKVYSEDLNNVANFAIKLGDYEGLVDGQTYIAYYYVRDKADNILNTNVRTAKFIYDNTAPVFAVEGKSNASKITGIPTYCATATVTGIEDGATVTVNGEVVTATEDGTYVINTAGNYLVTVTDKAGNKTSKKFVVNDDHTWDVKEVLSTCTEDGYKTEVCLICGDEKDKVVYPTTGHDWSTSPVPSTCTENGYNYKVCLACGEDEKIYEVNGELIDPAHGHIYDKVDGEIVYTVVTAATCKTKGKEIATCKACGETISREIAIDAEAHNWGSVKTLKATCTEDGKTYQSCKLCYTSKDLTVIPATGHKETQWVETTAPTCGTAGVETLQCKKCKALIGAYVIGWVNFRDDIVLEDKYEVVLDEDGNEIFEIDSLGQKFYQCYELDENGERIFNYETREIPATGRHILAAYGKDEICLVTEVDGPYKYILDNDGNKVTEEKDGVTLYQVYKTYDATADAEGQITRYCKQCGQEWIEKVAKVEKYTVKFVGEDGETVLYTIPEVVKGTTITKDYEWSVTTVEDEKEKTTNYKLTEPTKANSADGKYKYSFAGWVDENGTRVTLPFDVTGNVTLKATFAESTIIYTHQFLVPNVWTSTLEADATNYDEFAVLMGAMGDSRVPVAEPVFKLADEDEDAALKKLYTFKFLGWSTTGAEGDITEDFTIAGDATFYAVFEAKAVAYQVIYYNGTQYVWDTTVDGGEKVIFGGTEPTKASDADKHYTFDKWYTDETLKTEFDEDTLITALTRLYAGFKGEDHTWVADPDSEENKPANCTDAAQVAYKCACDATKVKSEGAALGHTPADAVTETVDGVIYSVVYCSVCEKEISRTKTSVTVAFKNWNGVRLDTQNLNVGDAIVYGGVEPTKADDNQYTYTFAGWYVEGDTTETVVENLGNASADVVYMAAFTATVRTFRVTYVDADNKTLQTTTGIAYGTAIPAYTGETPTKAYDTNYHYTFDKWSVAAGEGTEVTSDTLIQPVFNATKHDCKESGNSTAATCTTPGGMLYVCACGYSYTGGTIPATGHDFSGEPVYTAPDYVNKVEGKRVYTCKNGCGETKTETIPCDYIEIVVNVKDTNGKAVEGAVATLWTGVSPDLVQTPDALGNLTATTNADGIAKFYVVPGDYTVLVDGGSYKVKANEDGTITGNANVTVEAEKEQSCTCSCHRDSFWGTIFRFFQKIIKLFTGKAACCAEPDSRI